MKTWRDFSQECLFFKGARHHKDYGCSKMDLRAATDKEIMDANENHNLDSREFFTCVSCGGLEWVIKRAESYGGKRYEQSEIA